MKRFFTFLKNASPIILILISIGIGILAKLIERSFTGIAMGLQLLTFILFFYALTRLLSRKKQ